MSTAICNQFQTFNCGDTVVVTQQLPASAGAAVTLWMGLEGDTAAPTSTAGTEAPSGTFTFTLSNTATAALAPGKYRWTMVAVKSGATSTPAEGITYALPNPAVAQSPTQAQAMVALYLGVIQKFAGTVNQTVTFNGQSYTRANIKDYQEQLTFWQARVIADQAAIDRLRGGRDAGRIQTRFAPVGCRSPYNGWPWNNCQ